MAEIKEVNFFSSENYSFLDIVCGRSMIAVIANIEDKPPSQPEEPNSLLLSDVLNNYSHRELPKPSLNIDDLIEKSKLRRKTSRDKIKK